MSKITWKTRTGPNKTRHPRNYADEEHFVERRLSSPTNVFLPCRARQVDAMRHLPRDSSLLYGMDQWSVKTRLSSSYKLVVGNSMLPPEQFPFSSLLLCKHKNRKRWVKNGIFFHTDGPCVDRCFVVLLLFTVGLVALGKEKVIKDNAKFFPSPWEKGDSGHLESVSSPHQSVLHRSIFVSNSFIPRSFPNSQPDRWELKSTAEISLPNGRAVMLAAWCKLNFNFFIYILYLWFNMCTSGSAQLQLWEDKVYGSV